MLTGLNTPHVFTVPGEHDSTDDAGQKYRQAFGAGTRGDGWYSFDVAGVHLIGLVNTLNSEAKLGHLGTDQLDFIQKDVAPLSSDTPIVVFSHIPLFAMYPALGLGHRRRRPGLELSEALFVRDMPQRPCPPVVFQDRRQRDVLQRHHHRLPAAGIRDRARHPNR